ncbi:c-type cytochrome [Undibacterium sp. Di27W]
MKNILNTLMFCAVLSSPLVHAEGDVKKGKLLYSANCIACHSIEVSMAGPAHRGVFGRKVGAVTDFNYSPALKKSKLIWDEKNLDKWLSNPEKLIPGQQMGFSVAAAKDREDLIAYLKSEAKK